MRNIEQNRKSRVIKEFLRGLSTDEIAMQVGVSHGSVVNIINEFRDGTLPLPQGMRDYADELRRLVVDLKKHSTTIPQLKSYLKLHAKLRELGVSMDRVELWLDICEKVACHEAFSNELIESALEMERLSSETNLTYSSLVQDYRQKLEELRMLDCKTEEKCKELEEVKLKYDEQIEQAKKTLDLITRDTATAQYSLDQQKKALQSQLDEHLKQNRLSWRRIRAVEAVTNSGLNAAHLTEIQMSRLRTKLADTGSILIVTEQLEQERHTLKTEISRLKKKKETYDRSIAELQHADSDLRNSMAKIVTERNRLDGELGLKRAKLTQLGQEISEKIEKLYISRLILNFLFDPYRIEEDDLKHLVSIVIAMRKNWLVRQALEKYGRVIGECLQPKVYDDFSVLKVDIDHVRQTLAYMLIPLVKDKFIYRRH